MDIPIQNIYYLLCYAWNKMQEKDIVNVDASTYHQLPELLAKVLVSGCNRLLKQGLERNYVETTELYAGVKGKIEFNQSIRSQSFLHGKSYCQFDEFSADILPNRLIKACLKILSKSKEIDKDLHSQVFDKLIYFSQVTDICPVPADFDRVKIHRNNSFYDFLLNICRIVIEQVSLDEKSGQYKFRDLWRDQSTMQAIFEQFVRNFYSVKLSDYKVRSEKIAWNATPIDQSRFEFMPEMRTDISLSSNNRKIIIDTKYYREALTLNRFGNKKFHSGNLYQIYSYLKNLEHLTDSPANLNAMGILLYPTTTIELDEKFQVENHVVQVCTVNLAADWKQIETRLLDIIPKA